MGLFKPVLVQLSKGDVRVGLQMIISLSFKWQQKALNDHRIQSSTSLMLVSDVDDRFFILKRVTVMLVTALYW